jgi:hypothetical protein
MQIAAAALNVKLKCAFAVFHLDSLLLPSTNSTICKKKIYIYITKQRLGEKIIITAFVSSESLSNSARF